jgi:hypothetical protein
MSPTDDDSSSDSGDIDLFAEPEDWKPKEKPCTFQTYSLEEKDDKGVITGTKKIKLRLVGSSPLWVSDDVPVRCVICEACGGVAMLLKKIPNVCA